MRREVLSGYPSSHAEDALVMFRQWNARDGSGDLGEGSGGRGEAEREWMTACLVLVRGYRFYSYGHASLLLP